MKIAIVGFGKMGHMIKNAASNLSHKVVTIDTSAKDADVIIDSNDKSSLVDAIKKSCADGVIEFSHPSAVVDNIKAILPLNIPLVVGTTGWEKNESEIADLAKKVNGAIMRSSNFSIGVNIFYKIVSEASRLLSSYSDYDIALFEMHHNQKADSPSGTALEIAKLILQNNENKTEIIEGNLKEKPLSNQLHITSSRCGATPGTHTVYFDSSADTIELTHRARSREGLALGAVVSLEKFSTLLSNGKLQRGKIYGMSDLF